MIMILKMKSDEMKKRQPLLAQAALKRFRVKAKATQNATTVTPTSKLKLPATLLGH
jgi:hypothetical protein